MSDKQQMVYLPIAAIKPYENNPRKNDPAVDKVVESLRAFGPQAPIIVDKDYVIIAGHTRWKAAKKLGMDEFPCVVAEQLDEEQVRAYRLADNKTGEFADWDEAKLDEELAEILNIDMELFGFDLGDDEPDDKYTMKTDIPQYEVAGDQPNLADMLDSTKADELIAEIESAEGVTDAEKQFLIQAARRHNVFNYRNIAENYANATPEMQQLMEKSALVIIDLDNAIAYGYAKLSDTISSVLNGESDPDAEDGDSPYA